MPGIYGRIAQPRVNQDQDNATRIKSRVQNERIRLLLILVDPESTVCPGKGKVSRTSCIFLILVDSIIEIITEKG